MKLPVCVASALVINENQTIPLRVVNTSLTPTTLYRNSKVAIAEQIIESTIYGTVEGEEWVATGVHHKPELLLAQPLPDDITETEKAQFIALLSYYSDVIAVDPEDLGRTTILQHHINTGISPPIRQPVRRIPLPRRDTVHQDMVTKGIISPSKNPWASPIVLVRKKDGTTRFRVDYRKINDVTVKDAYPLPRVDDTLDTLAGSVWFSTLDLKSGYWQVEVLPEDREKTSRTPMVILSCLS